MKFLLRHNNTIGIYLLLLFIGFIVYRPMLSNGFVWDDLGYIIKNIQLHTFNFTVLYDNYLNTGPHYRQISALYFSFMYSVFGAQAFPYHLVSLILHISTSFLVFLLLKKYLPFVLSTILTLIFLVHPINAESVLWMSSFHSLFFNFTGLLAVLLIHKKELNQQDILILTTLLFITIITYEAGILYFVIVLLLAYIRKSSEFKKLFFICCGIFLFYIYLRFIGNAFGFTSLQDHPGPRNTILEKILTMPSIIYYYLKTVIIPYHLMIWQYWVVERFTLQLFIAFKLLLITTTILLAWLFDDWRKKKLSAIHFFTLWFIIGIVSVLQIYPLDMTVSDRWFYFPFIGLLGIIGLVYQQSKKYHKQYTVLLVILSLIVSIIYGTRTYIRTFDWKDDITLFTHDIQLEPYNIPIYTNLAIIHYDDGNYEKALPYLQKLEWLASTDPLYKEKYAFLGKAYAKFQKNDKAIEYLYKAIKDPEIPRFEGYFDTYQALAEVLTKEERYQEVVKIISDKIVSNGASPKELLYLRANANYHLKNYKVTEKDIEFLYITYNIKKYNELYHKIKKELKHE